jgi:hypothetical protein
MDNKSRWFSMTEEQREKDRIRKKAWHVKNAGSQKIKKKVHYESKKDYYKEIERNRQYKKMYGISIVDYDSMLKSQNGKCKVCGSDKSGPKERAFSVDHCHTTGRVRGLLCTKCNVAVGFYEKHHEAVLKYLQDS